MLILSIPFLNPEFVREHSSNKTFPWKEYRLDYQPNLQDFPFEILDSSSIVTLRNSSEGGKNNFTENEKIRFYQKVVAEYNCLVDHEIQLHERDSIDPANLILSYHNFSEEPELEKLEQVIRQMNESQARFVKIAVNVNSYRMLLKISQLLALSRKPVIFAGMGRLGFLSRLLHLHLGAVGTFFGLEAAPTANGQFFESDLLKFNLRQNTRRTLLGGIIGGKQVYGSLGLEFYNNYFRQNDIDAVYLPFAVDDLSDFFEWFEASHFKDRFYGFSITMPFKQKFTKQETINLFLPNQNRFLNTDKSAFQKTIDHGFVQQTDSILIVGSGATARVALEVYGLFPNVEISCRNDQDGMKLTHEFNRELIPFVHLAGKEFDLIVNCTTIGMAGENFLELTNLKSFKKAIDLPYREENTLLTEHCLQKSLPCVDGKMFWQWQAEEQLAEFLEEINKC
ncbi:MAG: type I 3-dehydroquinate dehydratase [Candidatus Cloacimonadales bacterium]|nr:type I 3-dehydroquinate dehydratase [Candidatus Cloacimonadales bacterium]